MTPLAPRMLSNSQQPHSPRPPSVSLMLRFSTSCTGAARDARQHKKKQTNTQSTGSLSGPSSSTATHVCSKDVVALHDAGLPLGRKLQLLARGARLLAHVDDVVGVQQQDGGVVGEAREAGLRGLLGSGALAETHTRRSARVMISREGTVRPPAHVDHGPVDPRQTTSTTSPAARLAWMMRLHSAAASGITASVTGSRRRTQRARKATCSGEPNLWRHPGVSGTGPVPAIRCRSSPPPPGHLQQATHVTMPSPVNALQHNG